MKSLLTVATGVLVLAASGVSACPLMEAKQQTAKQDQHNQTLVESDVNKVDSTLLVKLTRKQEKATN